jgi:hypothetical protein
MKKCPFLKFKEACKKELCELFIGDGCVFYKSYSEIHETREAIEDLLKHLELRR